MSELDELKEQVRELKAEMDVILRASAEAQSLTLQKIAHIETVNSSMRVLLSVVSGESRSKLHQRQLQSFDENLQLLSKKFQAWQKIAASGVPLHLPPDSTDDLKQN